MAEVKLRKGDRVRYTWPNDLIGKPPVTKEGTVRVAHRDRLGSVTVTWDGELRKWWFQDAAMLTKIDKEEPQ